MAELRAVTIQGVDFRGNPQAILADDGNLRVDLQGDGVLRILDVLERIQQQLSMITGVNLERGERMGDA